ncbi:Sua5/YciO/YrdC/YwlC family protein [Alteromonas lipolytica]|uniref:Threonylcarbamoyl-AMP synthase n=1 Tax=Alteromonas lipolytica TaxID=1856405 RepID=A0A1E8FAB0_9ALTE|nr:Sua5/YciO/YrdC/YwlC family protein [Alteromonas lipolytica]OFI32849.1 L-threonylcarbamoyladenylate synthase type 1 TsaC [Alteromonas lipolytica]GGF64784.1 threonylcarbamoyl-AMP synthase [Alteromonas lipolytica]
MSVESVHQDADIAAFESGKLLVYPTEAVMGIGCDPDNEEAVLALLALKQRPVEKGLILLAANYSQLLPYVDDNAIPQDKRFSIFSCWPGPVTWLLPKSATAAKWLTGEHDAIAVRVTAHAGARALCDKLGRPIVSTSANLTGQEPARTPEQARQYFADSVHYVDGVVGGASQPSTIKDALTGATIRN